MVTNNIEEYKGVYVFAQQVDNEVSGIALELLGKGKELAAKLDEFRRKQTQKVLETTID